MRIFAIAKALEKGYTPERIEELTKIDVWFINKLKNIVDYTKVLSQYKKIEDLPTDVLREAKRLGFSDFQIARFVENPSGTMEKEILRVRDLRKKNSILPAVRRINTVASEHPELTNYLYMTYGETEHSISYAYKNDKSIIVLGSGAYRIGSSVEFDWCSVICINQIRKHGYKGILINYNPETVSTDYDMSDRLYFDELSFERVLDICELEQPVGVGVDRQQKRRIIMLSDEELEKIIESNEEYKRFNDLPLQEQAETLITIGESILKDTLNQNNNSPNAYR